MDTEQDPLENFWDNILSRDPERIRTAFQDLTGEEQQALMSHLSRMASEDDWHPEQKKSALAALEALGSRADNT